MAAGRSMDRTPAAIITGMLRLYLPTNWVMITVSGWVSALLAKMSGIVNSPRTSSTGSPVVTPIGLHGTP